MASFTTVLKSFETSCVEACCLHALLGQMCSVYCFMKNIKQVEKRQIDAAHIDPRFKDCVFDFHLFCSFQCIIFPNNCPKQIIYIAYNQCYITV